VGINHKLPTLLASTDAIENVEIRPPNGVSENIIDCILISR